MKYIDNLSQKTRKFSPSKFFNFLTITVFVFSFIKIVSATAPNPGHNFVEVGGGAVQGDMLYASSADTLSALAKNTSATRYISNTGTSNNPAWAQIDLTNGVTGSLPAGNGGTGINSSASTGVPSISSGTWSVNSTLPLTLGGTNASLTASNGGIFYSTASAGAILAGTATANKVLMSGSSTTPVWSTPTYPNASATSGTIMISDGTNYIASTPTYPNAAGTSGNFLKSDGTNFVSSSPSTIATVVTRPTMATGATLTTQTFSTVLTARKAGLFNVPAQITVNKITFQATVAGTTPSYTMKVCIYNEAGTSKLIDITTAAISATSVVSTAVSAVKLDPGNYYVVYGPATQSGTTPTIALTNWTTTAATWVNTSAVPAGKRIYEGTLTSASGVCDSTMGTITGTVSSTPVMRLDN